jgi:hypothetical protein
MNVDVEAVAATVERDGIAIMREVMAPDLLCRIRVRLDELNREEREAGTAFLESEGANQRVFNLVNKGELFEEIVQFPPVVEVVRRLRGVRPFLRVQENRLVSVRPQVWERANPTLRHLLGGDLYLNAVGFIDGPPPRMRKLAFPRRKQGVLA